MNLLALMWIAGLFAVVLGLYALLSRLAILVLWAVKTIRR